MNPWTRDVLGDLACALYSCGLEPIPCMEGTPEGLITNMSGRNVMNDVALLADKAEVSLDSSPRSLRSCQTSATGMLFIPVAE